MKIVVSSGEKAGRDDRDDRDDRALMLTVLPQNQKCAPQSVDQGEMTSVSG